MANPYLNNDLMKAMLSGQLQPNVLQKVEENKRRQLAERERLQQNEMVRRQQQANLRGTQLGNTKSALDIARSGRPQPIDPYKQAQIDKINFEMEQARSAKPKLTDLQRKMEYVAGKPFGELTIEEKRGAFQTVNQKGPTTADRRLDFDISQAAQEASNPKPAAPSFAEKEKIKANQKRLSELGAGNAGRQESIARARKFLDAFDGDKKTLEGFGFDVDGLSEEDLKDVADTGTTRAIANWFPGVYTPQGQFDQDLDAFSEEAARAFLKASGETKVTDEDVKGAKRAVFGLGKDEVVNKRLLETFIRQQEAMQAEYEALSGSGGAWENKSDEDLLNF